MSELQVSQIETIVAAFGSIREAYEAANGDSQAVVDAINAKMVGDPPESLVQKEIGRDLTIDDLREAWRRRQMRILFEDIEQLCRTAVSGGFTLAQLKNQIVQRCS